MSRGGSRGSVAQHENACLVGMLVGNVEMPISVLRAGRLSNPINSKHWSPVTP